jgi:metal-sulfur cluster biosynthetic enzyme
LSSIAGGVRRALTHHAAGRKIEVDVVWEPRWSPEMISQEAKEQLGFF